MFSSFHVDIHLTQVVKEPTRVADHSSSLIDHVLMDSEVTVLSTISKHILCKSIIDHQLQKDPPCPKLIHKRNVLNVKAKSLDTPVWWSKF